METLECIKSRRSVRKFLDIPVEAEKLSNILEAAQNAPCAGNLQEWKFILVTDKPARQKVAEACLEQYWISSAPLVIIACSDPSKPKKFYDEAGERFAIMDASAAVENMLLAVHDQGLASCWVSGFEEEMLRREFNIPDSVFIIAVLPIGYPDEKVPVPPKLTLENITFISSYGNRVKDIAAYMEWYGEHVQKVIKKGKELVKKFVKKLGE
ncbi:hypothetical protein DRJ22_01620 [Candidatus Woesearchaeota archaeon]|nr:MAG: nitroreductase [Candidatus Woesearchaeota archaeon ex4484_78]RLE46553.1 MAG: hypothetical protein DRJ22_01620 [Candidatus Woesearchaeota archaeon]